MTLLDDPLSFLDDPLSFLDDIVTSRTDKGKEKLEEETGAADKNQEKEAAPSSRGKPTRYSAAHKGKLKIEEGTGADKNQEKEAAPSSRGKPTRYLAANNGKLKIEEGAGADKNKEIEAAPSSRRKPTRYPAADKGKQKLEEGQDLVPPRYSAAEKGKQKLEEETEADKLEAERVACLERAKMVTRMVADKIIEEREAASRETRFAASGFPIPMMEIYSPEVRHREPTDWGSTCITILFVVLIASVVGFLAYGYLKRH